VARCTKEGPLRDFTQIMGVGKVILTQEQLNIMLLAKDENERTAWHIASEEGQIQVLYTLSESGKEVLTQEQLNNIFLPKDECEWTAWIFDQRRAT